MDIFDRSPSNAQLQTLVDPEGAPPCLTLTDDGTTLSARPRPWPMAVYWAGVSLPVVGWCVALVWKWDDLLGSQDGHRRVHAAVMTGGMLVVAVGGWFGFQMLNRQGIRADRFFVIDRAGCTLTLPRVGVTLRRGDVTEVVEVHCWHRVRDAEGSSATFLREVSVLARGPGGQLSRYAVVVAGHSKPVGQVAVALSSTFAVPHRKLVESLFGSSWRQVLKQSG